MGESYRDEIWNDLMKYKDSLYICSVLRTAGEEAWVLVLSTLLQDLFNIILIGTRTNIWSPGSPEIHRTASRPNSLEDSIWGPKLYCPAEVSDLYNPRMNMHIADNLDILCGLLFWSWTGESEINCEWRGLCGLSCYGSLACVFNCDCKLKDMMKEYLGDCEWVLWPISVFKAPVVNISRRASDTSLMLVFAWISVVDWSELRRDGFHSLKSFNNLNSYSLGVTNIVLTSHPGSCLHLLLICFKSTCA